MRVEPKELARRVCSRPRRVLVTIGIVAIVLVALRIALPWVIQKQINDRLTAIPGYAGNVGDIDLSLIRGAYSLENVAIYKISGAAREPFVLARHIDFSVAWRELFRGKIVSDIHADEVDLTFVAAGADAVSQKDIDRRWQDVIQDIFPLEITHLELTRSAVRYQDLTKAPHVDVFIRNMHVLATGLRNRPEESGEKFPAEITIDGDSLGGGKLRLFVAAEPLAAQPHFHLSAKIDDVNLPDLNPSLRAVANVDVSRGTFSLAGEMAGKDGGFQGYVKPFFDELNFNNLADRNKNVVSRIWENVIQGLAWLVKNKPRNQVATRIPFQGEFGDPQIGLWATITNLFRHGFVRAFNPTVEGTLRPENVLPSGESADGRPVAESKSDSPRPAASTPEPETNRAGAPTGRPSEPPRRP